MLKNLLMMSRRIPDTNDRLTTQTRAAYSQGSHTDVSPYGTLSLEDVPRLLQISCGLRSLEKVRDRRSYFFHTRNRSP